MSVDDQPMGDRCGKRMPRAKAYCGRAPGHAGECRTPAALAERRARLTDRRRGKTLVTPEVRSRWHRAHYWVRYGITEAEYNQMLADQGNACAICRTPFQGRRVCIDHDHACCPVPASGHTRSCGKCIRGLLCVRCNTWLGWMETATVKLTLANEGQQKIRYTLTPNDYEGRTQTVTVQAGRATTISWPTGRYGYYDVVITANTPDGFRRRYAGRIA